jgi:hypothetical protein
MTSDKSTWKPQLKANALVIQIFIILIFPALVLCGDFNGLWVGTATISGVSQVNRAVPDLSFDLGLSGFKQTQTLVAQNNAGWTFNNIDKFSDENWTMGTDNSANWSAKKEAPFYACTNGTAIADNQQATTYVRKTVNLGDTSNYAGLYLKIWAKGGIDVYLNSANLLKENLATGSDNIILYEITIPLSTLYQNSDNILAAAIHDDAEKSGVYFDMELIAHTKTNTNIILVSKTSSNWTYLASETDPGLDWMDESFNDSAWTSNGTIPFYLYRTGTFLTHINTSYFRNQFQLDDASPMTGLHLNVWRDDGIVVYLNGIQIFKNNMPYGDVTAETNALYEITSSRLAQISLPADALQTGMNVLAVEIHSSGSSDNELYFDLELTAGVEENLISTKASGWKFSPTTTTQDIHQTPQPDYLGRTWTHIFYDDIGWGQGQAKIGFGDGDEKTELGYNLDVWPKTFYFRHKFTPAITELDALRLQLLRDDGAVVYLNGTEIFRSNLPAGIIEYDTPPVTAIGPSNEGKFVVQEIDLNLQEFESLITPGDNIIAVEVHQHPSETGSTQVSNTAVTPTPAIFDMRLLLHNDTTDTIRLLKEVYQMYRQENSKLVPVLLPNDLLIPNYQGPGWRISSIGTDFSGTSIVCSGAMSPTGLISCEIEVPENHPTNPFLHQYHPDHDNWDTRYEKKYPIDLSAPEESFKIKRMLSFTFEEKYPPGCEGSSCRQFPPPGWGYSSIGGGYKEVISGLHKDDITVTGSFQLDRVSVIDGLEQ